MLSKFLKDRINIAKKIIEDLSDEYEYISIFGKHANTNRIMLNANVTSVGQSDRITDSEAGFVIKVYNDNHYSEYSIDDIKDLDYGQFKEAIKLHGLKQEYVSSGLLTDEPLVKSFNREENDRMSDDEIISSLKDIKEYIENYDQRIVNVFTVNICRETSSIFVSKNKCLDQYYVWNHCMIQVVSADDKGIKTIFKSENEVNVKDALKKLDNRKEEIAKLAIKMLEAKTIIPGTYDVITDPSISGLIAHEAFGHGVEMDMFVKNRAKAKDFVNKQVASELVNMHDGASATLSSASYFFDDDGILTNDTQIIKDGILVDGLSDVLTALELNKKPSGNSRRESTRRKAYTRMTNTFFGAGKDNVDDMIKSIKHGYYLCDTNNGMEDPKNWQIQCTAQYALEIEDGKFNGNIYSPVVISGYVPDLLKSISMVSDEVIITGSGMCGKGHKEWVYVADGGPYLKARVKLG